MPLGEQDHYQVLGISAQASDTEIRGAYRELVKVFHPDRHSGAVRRYKRDTTR